MTDQHPEVVTIELGGERRHLKYGMASFRRAEKRGVSLHPKDLLQPSLGLVPVLIWIGLLKDDPELKEDTVLDWLDEAPDPAGLADTVLKAFKSATEGDEGNGKPPVKRRRKTG